MVQQEYKQTIFTVAHTHLGGISLNNHERTLRLTVQSNIDAFAISVQFSNRCGKTPLPIGAASLALCNEEGTLHPDTLVPVTVDGLLSFELPAGKTLLSDTISFQLQPGDYFALNIYYPTEEKVVSGNWMGQVHRSKHGNFSADLKLPVIPSLASRLARTVTANDLTTSTTSVAQIIAHSEVPARVLGCFGDSITQQGNWTTPLQKLLHRCYPGEISLCNLGISGNRLLADSAPVTDGLHGVAGITRFDEDLLNLPGLTHAIIEIGTNDIGQPGTDGIPEEDIITVSQYAEAMEELAKKLHAKNIKTYVATLPPRVIDTIFTAEREAIRQEMNDWIRSASCFDAVLDFDAALRRPDGKPGMRDNAALIDGLHPSPYGGLLLAKSIDLALFGGNETIEK